MSQPLEMVMNSKTKDSLMMADDGAMFGTPMHNYGTSFPPPPPSELRTPHTPDTGDGGHGLGS